jgi:hypothetical protein
MDGRAPRPVATCHPAVAFGVVQRPILHASASLFFGAKNFFLRRRTFLQPHQLTTVCRYQISMILSSSSPTPSTSTIFAKASLSPQVFLDGVAVHSTDNDRWSFTVPQSSRSLLFVQLSGALALLNFSFSIDSAVSALPVRPAIHFLRHCLFWFLMQRVVLPRSSSAACSSQPSRQTNKYIDALPHECFPCLF